jgi:hypothetical protein
VSIIKKISVVYFAMAVSAAGAMEQVVQPYKRDQNLSFKLLKGFPLTSLSKGSKWATSLSQKEKDDVYERIIQKNDVRLLALFNVATKLPLEVQEAIALKVFEHKEQVSKFLNIPIAQAYCYQGFLDIINDKEINPSVEFCSKSSHFKADIVCELAKDIIIFNKWNEDASVILSKNQLKSLDSVVGMFQDVFSLKNWDVSYEFYGLPTLNDIKKQFSREQLMLLPLFLALYINVTFPAALDEVFDQKQLEFNELADRFNSEVACLRKKKGNQLLYVDYAKTWDPYKQTPNRFFVIKIWSWLPVIPLVLDCLVRCMLINKYEMERLAYRLVTKKFLCITPPVLLGIYKLMFSIGSQFEKARPWGVGCMAGFYALMCCGYNVFKAMSWRQGTVSLNNISALLKRTDIVIK